MGTLGNTGPSQIGVDRRLENLALDTNELSLFDLEYDDQDSEKHSTNSVCSRRSLRSVHSIRSTHSARTSFHRRSLILSSENESYGTISTVSDFSLATQSTDRVIQGQVYLLSDKDDWSIERAPTNECFFSFTGCNERPDVAHWVPHAKEHIRRQGIHQDPGPLECGICGVRVTEGTWSSVFIHAFIHLQPGGIVRRDSNLLGHLMGYGIITLRQLGALNIHQEGGILPPSTSIPGPRSPQDSTQPQYANDTQAAVLHHGGSELRHD